MGLFSNPFQRRPRIEFAEEELKFPKRGEILEDARKERALRGKKFERSRFEVGRNVGQFGRVGLTRPDFSTEQQALREVMGGGAINKSWGFNNEPVIIYNDLNPRQRGDRSTGELFGF